jgi:hypothetical protein
MPATVEGGGYRGRSGIETYYREVRDTWSELRVGSGAGIRCGPRSARASSVAVIV